MSQFPLEGTKYRLILVNFFHLRCKVNVLFISPRNLLLCREIAWECSCAIKGVIQNIKKNIHLIFIGIFQTKKYELKIYLGHKGPFYISFLLVIYNKIIMN